MSYWNKIKKDLKKMYRFVMHDDSLLSWVVNIALAFVLVKFVIYPLLAFVLGSSLPLVAVVSGSMEHNGLDFDTWWEENKAWYEEQGISKDLFIEYNLHNGFSKGDVIVLVGSDSYEVGDILVYDSGTHPYPIIHRVTYINDEGIQFKGDNNNGADPSLVQEEQLLGKAWFKIPWIGWVKIWVTELFV